MTQGDILILARALAEARRVRLRTVSGWVTGGNNPLLFDRLVSGFGCSTRAVDAAADWFRENWPEHVVWPPSVPREEPAEARERSGVLP